MINKILTKIFSIILMFVLSFNPTMTASLVYAQEAPQPEQIVTPQPESSPQPSPSANPQPSPSPDASTTPSPELSPQPSPEPSPSPTPSSSPQPSSSPVPPPPPTPSLELSPQITASPSASPTPSLEPSPSPTPQPLWTQTEGGYTTQTLQFGVTYHFPPNESVTVTFTQLPEGSGTVTVKEHEVPPTVENPGSLDYEITSTMPNDSFSFDLTLPTNDPNKEVLKSEDGQNYEPVTNETVVSSDIITIKGITHLTHFIVAGDSADFFHPVINEFFVAGVAEWIELYNPMDEEFDLTGWVLDDNGASATTYTFGTDPGPTTIGAKSFLVVEDNFGLNDGGDTVRLRKPDSTLFDSRTYPSDPGSKSIGRIIDGGPDFQEFTVPTKGLSNGTTLSQLYVNLDWDSPINAGGHTWGFDAFADIQQAINFAPESSTINIEAGDYNLDNFDGTLDISKTLSLVGPGINEEDLARIFASCNRVLDINANNVTVQGLYLADPDFNQCSPVIRISSLVSGATIQENDIAGGSIGIELRSNSSGNLILNNVIHHNSTGITVRGSQDNTISGNEIFDNNDKGILLRSGDVSGNTISENNIYENQYGIYGRSNITFSDLSISGNGIADNFTNGIYFEEVIDSVGTLTIDDNDVTDSGSEGIYLNFIQNSTVNITNNNVNNNSSYGIYLPDTEDGTVNISGNTVTGNSSYAVYLSEIDYASFITIDDNDISNNSDDGLVIEFLGQQSCGGDAPQVTVSNNILNNNSSDGFYQYDDWDCGSQALFENNEVSGNGDYGFNFADYYLYNATADFFTNVVENNGSAGFYFYSLDGANLTLNGNTVSANGQYGIYLTGGSGIYNSNVSLDDNTITDNASEGIYIDNIYSESTVDILNNTIAGNGGDGDNAGVYVNYVSDSTLNLQGNSVSDNFGQGFYLCSEGYCSNTILDISGNTVSANGVDGGYAGVEIYSIGGLSSLSIAGNEITGNGWAGIYLYEVNDTDATIGEDNNIAENLGPGIYLDWLVNGVNILGNTITGNGFDSGEAGIYVGANGNEVHLNNISGNNAGLETGNGFMEVFVDAIENWWGSIFGPEGEGADSISGDVLFHPWCLDQNCQTVFAEAPENSLLEDVNFGIPPGATLEDTPSLSFLSDEIFTIADTGGTSTVTIPTGVVIRRSDSVNFDASELISDDVNVNSLAGLGTGVVADGALQWGLPNIELTFTSAITLSIFVGTSLTGQTLNVVRSTTGTDGWTPDGIVAPGTCLVTNGLCTFQATLASFFATTRTVTTSSTATSTQALSAASGSVAAPTCSDTKPGSAPTLLSASSTGSNQVTLTWGKAKDPVTYYLVNYSEIAGTFQYGNPNVGGSETTSFVVSGLSGGTTYYFKVRAGNGCAPGDYSNELSAAPSGGFISGPAAGFAPGVLGATTDQDVGLGEVKGEDITPTPESALPPPSPQPQANLWQLIGGVLGAIFGFFGRLFGR